MQMHAGLTFLTTVTASGVRWARSVVHWAIERVRMPPERRDEAAEDIGALMQVVPLDYSRPEADTASVVILDPIDAVEEQYLRDLGAAMAQIHREFAVRTAEIIEQMEQRHGN